MSESVEDRGIDRASDFGLCPPTELLEAFPNQRSLFAHLDDSRPPRPDSHGWIYPLPGLPFVGLKVSPSDLPQVKTWLRLHERGLPLPKPVATASRALDAVVIFAVPLDSRPVDELTWEQFEKHPSLWIDIAKSLHRLHQAGWAITPMAPWGIWVKTDDHGVRVDALELHQLKRCFPWQYRTVSDAWGSFFAGLSETSLPNATRKAVAHSVHIRSRAKRRGLEVSRHTFRRQGLLPRMIPTSYHRGRGTDWVVCHPLLKSAASLNSTGARFEDWFPDAEIRELRRLSNRKNSKVIIDAPGGRLIGYLKWHIHDNSALPQGPYEWNRHVELRSIGIRTPLPAAQGVLGSSSFFMSFEIAEGRPLDRLLEGRGHLSRRTRREVLLRLADMVSRLHTRSYSHRDLYLCHVYWNPSGLNLLDLQRVESHLVLPMHRRIKDLAALEYSSRATGVSHLERLRFICLYMRLNRLDSESRAKRRSFVRRIQKKADSLVRRNGPSEIGGETV